MNRSLAIAVAVALAAACGGRPRESVEVPPASSSASREAVNLEALARLYGVVRWFHPSDEAAAIDWDRYAVVGVRDVRGARDPAALRATLAAWIAPLGPTVEVLQAGESPRPRVVDASAPQVAWQHVGPGFDGGGSAYSSRRTNRVGWRREVSSAGAMFQRVDAAPLRGFQIRLRAQVRAGVRTRVGAWLRVDRPNNAIGFFDNMGDRAVTDARWTAATIVGPVAADAEAVYFGGLAVGEEGWFDAFSLEVEDGRGGWRAVAVVNAELDDGTTGWDRGNGKGRVAGFELAVANARDGKPAAHVKAPRSEITADLFEERPAADEVAEVDLGDGLRARVPLSLASAGEHTVPAGDLAAAEGRIAGIAMTDTDADVRAADIIVAWSALAHFYPYHDVLARPWASVLAGALADAQAARTPLEHVDALRRLIAALDDGHGRISGSDPRAGLPLGLGLVEGKVVVLASELPAVARGDVIVAIDGEPVAKALERERSLVSGSPQWRMYRALGSIGQGAAATPAQVTIERDGATRTVAVARSDTRPPESTYPPVGEVKPGVWLVDLARAEVADIKARLPALAAARGIVFDLRGYPNGTHFVLEHLLPKPESDRWMHVARLIRPNVPGSRPPSWHSQGWDMTPAEPAFRGKVAFMTGAGAISYAESVMGYVEALGLPIVGGSTAGANGNIRTVPLPSGASFTYTGMKVTRHDGRRSHVEGIRPTVPVEPTLAGIRAGKDEVLERALAVVAP